MAATANVNTLVDGTKRRVIHVELIGDTDQFSDKVIYDYSADSELPGDHEADDIVVEWIKASGDFGTDFQVSFDGATDYAFAQLAPTGEADLDYRSVGGIRNLATTPTGDITLTSTGFTSGKNGTLTLSIRKT